MKAKIWKTLAQIVFYYNDSADLIKPFFENLNNESINDEKSILKTLPKHQLEVLYNNGIINKANFSSLISKNKKEKQYKFPSQHDTMDYNTIEEIISEDKIKELQEFIQEHDLKQFKIIYKSFKEVEKMKIPLIQYCIMKKAINCFKYLLINGFDDPNKLMEEQRTKYYGSSFRHQSQHNEKGPQQYEWDCMATAIYFGANNIIKILEDKGIEKGKNHEHLEAAILSYRNSIAKRIIEEIKKYVEKIEENINISPYASRLALSRKNKYKWGADIKKENKTSTISIKLQYLIFFKY